MNARLFPYLLLVFIVLGATGLTSIVVRNPDTHGHLWRSVPHAYGRTPVKPVEASNLEALEASLPRFSFPPPSPQYVARASNPAAPTPSADEAHQIVLKQFEYGFEPDRDHSVVKLSHPGEGAPEIRLAIGVPVQLKVVNEGKQVHGIWIPDFAINDEVRSGKEKTFAFTPQKSGRIRFVCSYNLCGTDEEHARMVGFFVVE